MSTSESDTDSNKITDYWPRKYTCDCGATDCSNNADSDDFDSEVDESSDTTSIDESIEAKRIIFISIFNHKTQKNKNLVSDDMEIENYRKNYDKLPLKNTKNINHIWGDVKVDMPILGQIPLRLFDKDLSEDTTSNNNNKKKKLNKPIHLMQKNVSLNSPTTNNSKQSVITNNSVTQSEEKQTNGKLPQVQVKKENTKVPEIQKINETVSKANVAPKNISNSNQNKNSNNKVSVVEKISESVINKSEPANKKTSSTNKNGLNIQSVVKNNSTKSISNLSNEKLSIENNTLKTNLIKKPVEVITKNKTEKNDKNEKKSSVASFLQKKELKEENKTAQINSSIENKKSTDDKTVKVNKNSVKSEVKTNTANKIEKSILVDQNTISNSENKVRKNSSIDSNLSSHVKDKIENNDLNEKKSEAALFKIPASNKNLLTPNKNEKENIANNKIVQSSKSNTVTKLSKKQEKKRRQRERKLEASNKGTSTSSSRDLSLSSNNSCNDKNFKNNSNKNVKDEADKPRKEKDTKFKKNSPENKKEPEPKHSDQDTENSDFEEMNTSNDDLDFITNKEHMPFISDILKRQEQNKQVKAKSAVQTSTKNKDKKNMEQEKIKIENEHEFIVSTRKRKLGSASDKDYLIYSDRYAEESVEMILQCNLMGALEYITIAIDYNPSDYRHYLNRSYCYLRMNQPAYALTDAQYVIQLCSNIGHLFIANLRAGQAAYALKNFKQAENFLKEANRINPENHHAQRELLRVKISHVMSLGFKEKDALTALNQYSSTLEAIDYLNKTKRNSSISKLKHDFNIHDYNCDDMVFASDDDEGECNDFQTLNKMLNYQPGKIKIQHLVAKPTKAEFLIGYNNEKNGKPKITPDVKKQPTPNSKCAYNNKAIWVGNLTNNINEQMLRKKFKQFGNIVSVYRPANEAYAFINFEKSEDVTNTLINNISHEIAGVKLAIRSAVRQK